MPYLAISISGQVASQIRLQNNSGRSPYLVSLADYIHAPVLLNDGCCLGSAEELSIAGQRKEWCVVSNQVSPGLHSVET